MLIGDASKAKARIGWNPKTKFEELFKLMACADFDRVKKRGYWSSMFPVQSFRYRAFASLLDFWILSALFLFIEFFERQS